MSVSEPLKLLPESVDFRLVKTLTPKYKYVLTVPQQAPPAAVPAATSDVVVVLPGSAPYSMGKTRICLQQYLTTPVVNNGIPCYFALFPSYRIQLLPTQGPALVDINFHRNFQKAVLPACISRQELLQFPLANTGQAAGGGTFQGVVIPDLGGTGLGNGLGGQGAFPCVTGAGAAAVAGSVRQMAGLSSLAAKCASPVYQTAATLAGWVNEISGGAAITTTGDIPVEIVAGTATNTSLLINWDVELQHLVPHSVLSIIQDLYWGQDLTLRITLHEVGKLGFTCSNVVTKANAAAMVTSSWQNFQVLQAVQDNAQLANEAKARTERGMDLPIQQVYMFQNSTQLGNGKTYGSVQNIISPGYGRSLLRAYSCTTTTDTAFAIANGANFTVPISIVGGGGVAPSNYASGQSYQWDYFQSFINTNATSPYELSVRDVWQCMDEFLKTSAYTSEQMWQMWSSVVIEDFSGLPHSEDLRSRTPEGGLSLAAPITHQVNFRKLNASVDDQTIWNWYVVSRIMRLTPAGVALM